MRSPRPIRAYWTDTHNLAEGAGAAALAAALQEKAKLAGKRVGLILCGGNIDFDLFRKWIGPEVAPRARLACDGSRAECRHRRLTGRSRRRGLHVFLLAEMTGCPQARA